MISNPNSQWISETLYGIVYVNRDDNDLKDLAKIPKDSFYWYQKVIETNGASCL